MSPTGSRFWNDELDGMSWERLQTHQAERLGASIADIASRSRFYAEKLDGLLPGSATAPSGAAATELLRTLPFTVKDELREAFEEGDAEQPLGRNQAEPTARIVQLVSSSGTSGRPVYYGLDAEDVERWTDGVANMFFTAGVRDGDVVAHLTSLPMVAGGLPFADGLRRVGASLAWLGGYTPERMLDAATGIHASCMSATTSFILYVTENCRRLTGREPHELGITRLLGGGEPGLGDPDVRARLREAWGPIEIREIMGLSDVMAGLWAECEANEAMHFTGAGQVFVELIDPSGEPVEWRQGSVGEIVYTALGRGATPLIRFRSGDQVVIEGVGCSCGRGTPRIRCLGRIDDMLIYKGMNVFPTAIRDVAVRAGAGEVTTNMRVWRQHPHHVRFDEPIPLEIETTEDGRADGSELRERIEAEVRKHLQVRVEVTLVEPGSIPRTDYKASLLFTASADGSRAPAPGAAPSSR